MIKRRKPIRRVSSKRAKANALYLKLRREYLDAHPFCQVYIKRFGLDEDDVLAANGAYPETNCGTVYWKNVPLATEIHHSRKPKSTYLNDTSTWFSACREQHEWVESNKSTARQLGLLHNI